MSSSVLKLNYKWKKTNDVYSLSNDQSLVNLENYLFKGQTASLFAVKEEVGEGLKLFNRMFQDYKNTTPNLQLLYKSQIKSKKKSIYIYIIKETPSEKHICHMFFEIQEKLYCLIFNIEKFGTSYDFLKINNEVFNQALKLIKVQE